MRMLHSTPSGAGFALLFADRANAGTDYDQIPINRTPSRSALLSGLLNHGTLRDKPLNHDELRDNQQKPDIEGCATANKLINDPKLRKIFEGLWQRTTESGEENGALLILEPEAKPISMIWGETVSEGRHIRFGTTDYAPNLPALPDIGIDTRKIFDKFRSQGRKVVLLAFFHTHPNYPGGDSQSGNPSGPDEQFQSDNGNALGIIRTGNGYSFFLNGKTFGPSDPRADECIQYNKNLLF
jgi:hypothetical protein